jgi:hypothetical protein
MINPKDIEPINTEEGKKNFGDEFIKEFTNGKGDDKNGSNSEVH